jgi:anti-sigma factor RsiW
MNEHDEIHELLTLAAAGALDEGEERRVQEHLRECSDCRTEFAAWQRITGALEVLPTPQAPEGLVERTRRQMERRATAKAEHRWNRNALVWLTVFAWLSTLLTWPFSVFMGDRVGAMLDLSSRGVTQLLIGYVVVSWMMSIVTAGLLGQRFRRNQEERVL